jgi:diguanylate cyclase (GGDEF)-like protein
MRISETARVSLGTAAALAGVAVIGWADYATGIELRLYPLYFVPISLAAWRCGRPAGLLVCLASTAAWEWSNHLAGRVLTWDALTLFNGLSQLVAFSAIALLAGTQRRQLDDERRASRADSLTGAANSRAFYETAAAEIARARRYGHALTVVYIDLDNFKGVNDRLGHHGGDRLLRRVSDALRGAVREVDTVARMGGDEFAVLLPETGPEGAAAAVQKLAAVAAQPAEGVGLVTASLGGVTFCTPPPRPEDLIDRADAMMYEAKRAGRNTSRVAVV